MAIALPSQIHAQQGGRIHYGNLSIIPGLELTETYDDNIFKGSGNPTVVVAPNVEDIVSDWITHIKPSLLFNYSLQERGLVSFGYMGDFARYKDNSGNNWKNHQGLLNVDYKAPSGFLFAVNESYGRKEDPFGSNDQYNIGRVTKRWSNDLKTKLGYGLTPSFRTVVRYNNYKQKYDSDLDASQDYTVNEGGIGLESRFLPKTWGFVRYLYGQQRYDSNIGTTTSSNNSDFNRNAVSLGLNWDADAKITGEVSLGYEWIKYNNALTPTGTARSDKNSWAAETSVNYLPTATTTLGLSLNRALRNTASNTNENFEDTSMGVTVAQIIMPKVTLKAGLTYGKNDYNIDITNPAGEARSDTNYRGNLGVDYLLREWLDVGLAYSYDKKVSNVVANEYKNNQFMAYVKVVY